MRVYHFLRAIYAIDDIKERHLKISQIDELNDPFELWCVAQEDRRLRKALGGFKKEMGERFGMICFSKRWHNPLLWSHYADRHRGICLGFEVDERRLKRVNYVTARPNLQVPPTKESMDELLFTKYRDWQYEEEWRGWFTLDERNASGHYFYPFVDMVRLSEVIAGPLCDTPKARIDEALKGYSDDIRAIKARLAFRTFRVVENQQGFPG